MFPMNDVLECVFRRMPLIRVCVYDEQAIFYSYYVDTPREERCMCHQILKQGRNVRKEQGFFFAD